MGRGQGHTRAAAAALLYGQRTSLRRSSSAVAEQLARQASLAQQLVRYGFNDQDVPSLKVILADNGTSLGPFHYDDASADRVAAITSAVNSGQHAFVCIGPSGHGKTLLVEQTAAAAGAPLVRLDDISETLGHTISVNGHSHIVDLSDEQIAQLRQALSSPVMTVIGTNTRSISLQLKLIELSSAQSAIIDDEPVAINGQNLIMLETSPQQAVALETVLAGATPINFMTAPDLSAVSSQPAQASRLNTRPRTSPPQLTLSAQTLRHRGAAVTGLRRALTDHEPRFSTRRGRAAAERLVEQIEQLVYNGDHAAVHKILAGMQLALPDAPNNGPSLIGSEGIDAVLGYASRVAQDGQAARQI